MFEGKMMDDIDRELLRLLTLDARQSATELGRILAVSRSTIQNRIDRLISQGVISRFTIELGEGHETPLVKAVLMIKVTSGDTRPLISKLKKISEIEVLTTINGAYDLMAELRASSLNKLDKVIFDVRSMQTVLDTNSYICLATYK